MLNYKILTSIYSKVSQTSLKPSPSSPKPIRTNPATQPKPLFFFCPSSTHTEILSKPSITSIQSPKTPDLLKSNTINLSFEDSQASTPQRQEFLSPYYKSIPVPSQSSIFRELFKLTQKERKSSKESFLHNNSGRIISEKKKNIVMKDQILKVGSRKVLKKCKEVECEIRKNSETWDWVYDGSVDKTPKGNVDRVVSVLEPLLHQSFGEKKGNSKKILTEIVEMSAVSVSPRSEKVLVDKFTREFNGIMMNFPDEINYLLFVGVLKKMCFVLENEKYSEEENRLSLMIWEALNVSGKINKAQLLAYFLAIMRYKPTKSLKSQLSSEESEKIHRKFQVLNKNPLSVINRSSKNPTFKNIFNTSLHPEISEASKPLNSSEKKKFFDKLAQKNSPSKFFIKNKEEYLKSKVIECTFKPKINNSSSKAWKSSDEIANTSDYQSIIKKNSNRNQALFNLAFIIWEKIKKNE